MDRLGGRERKGPGLMGFEKPAKKRILERKKETHTHCYNVRYSTYLLYVVL